MRGRAPSCVSDAYRFHVLQEAEWSGRGRAPCVPAVGAPALPTRGRRGCVSLGPCGQEVDKLGPGFRRVWFEILGRSGPLCFTVRPLPLFMRLGRQWAL